MIEHQYINPTKLEKGYEDQTFLGTFFLSSSITAIKLQTNSDPLYKKQLAQ